MTRGVCTNLPTACSKAAARTLLPCDDPAARCPECGAALLAVADGVAVGTAGSPVLRLLTPALLVMIALGVGGWWLSHGQTGDTTVAATSAPNAVAQAAATLERQPPGAGPVAVASAAPVAAPASAAEGDGAGGAVLAPLASLGTSLGGDLSTAFQSTRSGAVAGGIGAAALQRIAPFAEDQQPGDVLVARDALAVVVHPDSPLRQLSRPLLRDLLAGRVREGQRIGAAPGAPVIHLPAGSPVEALLKRQVLGEAAVASGATRHDGVAALLAAVQADPHAIGVVPRSALGSSGARAIALTDTLGDAWLPTTEAVAAERYPLTHRLVLRSSGEAVPASASAPLPSPSPLAAFLTGSVAQTKLAAHGWVSVMPALLDPGALVPSVAAGATSRWPRDYLVLTRSARPLAGRVAFAAGSDELDGVAQADVDRIAAHLKAQPAGSGPATVVVLGMANDPGGFCGNRALSDRRATRVAEALGERGVTVRVARGVGRIAAQSAPTAEEGALDRRVEVWLADGPVQQPGPFKCTPGPAYARSERGDGSGGGTP
jgi:phosphate transport system substrate-binding protein